MQESGFEPRSGALALPEACPNRKPGFTCRPPLLKLLMHLKQFFKS